MGDDKNRATLRVECVLLYQALQRVNPPKGLYLKEIEMILRVSRAEALMWVSAFVNLPDHPYEWIEGDRPWEELGFLRRSGWGQVMMTRMESLDG